MAQMVFHALLRQNHICGHAAPRKLKPFPEMDDRGTCFVPCELLLDTTKVTTAAKLNRPRNQSTALRAE